MSNETELNKEAIALWVKDLRDPDAKQITSMLGNVEGGRCCLGIACDTAVKAGIIPPPTVGENDYSLETVGENDYSLEWDGAPTGTLPQRVADWLGLDNNPVIKTQIVSLSMGESFPEVITATYANDALGWDFNKIADAVEKKFLSEDTVDPQ